MLEPLTRAVAFTVRRTHSQGGVCRQPARAFLLSGIILSLRAVSTHASEYPLTSTTLTVGEEQTVISVYEDTLYDLARRYSIGSEELIAVNPGIDPWLPGAGHLILIPGRHILPPGPRVGIIVNLPEHRLYYYPKTTRGAPRTVITYPVGIGKMDWRTPLGTTFVRQKEKNPIWYPPESVRAEHTLAGDPLAARVPSGPDNPLGLFALRLAVGNGTYLIHGTNNPIAVGMPVTHGCVRLYPEDIAALFPLVPVGTPVQLLNDPLKVAWGNGELLLEAHPAMDPEGAAGEVNTMPFTTLLLQAVGEASVDIDWAAAQALLATANGHIAVVAVATATAAVPGPVP
jgi:L,D-transpeptidase ErfK/SrfK